MIHWFPENIIELAYILTSSKFYKLSFFTRRIIPITSLLEEGDLKVVFNKIVLIELRKNPAGCKEFYRHSILLLPQKATIRETIDFYAMFSSGI